VEDTQPTEQQEDSARRLAGRDRARLALGYLRVVQGRCAPAVHEVRPGGTTIGRDAGDVRVDDSRVSRVHARIEHTAIGWRLVDLGSRNRGFVDGREYKPEDQAALSDGAVIRLGNCLFVFRTTLQPADGEVDSSVFPGVSPGATEVRRRIAALAAAPGHALVLGETGTGKERVARAIAAARKPFVAQNCGELGAELARSELFGHVQGAFSGATQSKPGLIDSAGDGALFLDEIGELSLEVQVDLLRFLEDGSYRAVGGQKSLRSAARVVAATNVDIDQAVAAGRFRRDLAARLRASNAPLALPPLRDRREDILQWCRLFTLEAGVAADDLWTGGALECLLLYAWPENLRELRGVVRALVADGNASPWPTELLPERIYAHRNVLRGAVESAPPLDDPTPPRREPTQAEIEDALRETGGKVNRAARMLGVERTKFYRLCRGFGIALEEHRAATQPEEE
jgi:DNA-binding NtrC family response regulator